MNHGHKRRHASRLRPVQLVGLALGIALLLGCGNGTELLKPDTEEEEDDNGNGGLQRGSLSVTAVATGEALQAAAALGWAQGAVPGAAVTIQRTGQTQRVTATTDAQGKVTFPDLLPGTYQISTARLLTGDETQRLQGTAWREINSFGGGTTGNVQPGQNAATLQVLGGSRGSLVFSEMFSTTGYTQTESYDFAHFFELYNNSDTTIYLDGKVLVQGFFPLYDREGAGCDVMAPYRLDPEAIYSVLHLQFPGTGQQYPLLPGRSALIAQDAINHAEFWPGMPDLRNADFESVGTSDVDNPAVPNMIDVSLRIRWQQEGRWHGMTLGTGTYYALTESVDVATLPVVPTPQFGNTTERRKFPREAILDISMVITPPENHPIQFGAYCTEFIHPNYDRAPAFLGNARTIETFRRKMLGRLADGRVILQRTRTSAADFEVAAPSPFVVP